MLCPHVVGSSVWDNLTAALPCSALIPIAPCSYTCHWRVSCCCSALHAHIAFGIDMYCVHAGSKGWPRSVELLRSLPQKPGRARCRTTSWWMRTTSPLQRRCVGGRCVLAGSARKSYSMLLRRALMLLCMRCVPFAAAFCPGPIVSIGLIRIVVTLPAWFCPGLIVSIC